MHHPLPRPTTLLALAVAVLAGACAGAPGPRLPPGALPAAPGAPAGVGASGFADPEGRLTLAEAFAAALLGSPDLAAADSGIRAAEARAVRAGLPANPEIELEMEEFGGEGERAGLGAAELSLRLSQEVPLGGRLAAEARAARIEGRLAGWDHEAARREVLAETHAAFVGVLAARELLSLAEEGVRVAGEVARAVGEQVRAGKAAGLLARKAEVEAALAKLARDRAASGLEAARLRLAATWGGTEARFRVEGDLHDVPPLPDLEEVRALLPESPEAARQEDAVDLAAARLATARAATWPDLTLTGGISRFEETGEHAFLAGVAFPLPLFDANRAGIEEARADLRRAEEERRAALVRIEVEFRGAWRELELAAGELETLAGVVVPAARAAFEGAQEGFRQGKFDYLEVLDGQRTLAVAREQLVLALAARHLAVGRIEQLIGRSLASTGRTGEGGGSR